jgi:hypothetical protein
MGKERKKEKDKGEGRELSSYPEKGPSHAK